MMAEQSVPPTVDAQLPYMNILQHLCIINGWLIFQQTITQQGTAQFDGMFVNYLLDFY